MADLFGIVTIECPQCGRKFDRLSTDWVYRRVLDSGIKYYCSYSCWIAADRQASMRKQMRKQFKLSQDEKKKLYSMIADGASNREIATALKITKECVRFYRKKAKP